MTDTTELEVRTWEWEAPPDDFLIGALQGRYIADEASAAYATLALIAKTFVIAGIDPDRAIELADKTMTDETEVILSLKRNVDDDTVTLHMEFERPDEVVA